MTDTNETKKPHPVDLHVGARIKARREMLGMSQVELGKELTLTFQQVQKYEKGTNRVGASRLFEIAQILGVPVQYFFVGLNETGNGDDPVMTSGAMKRAVKIDNIDNPMVIRAIDAMIQAGE